MRWAAGALVGIVLLVAGVAKLTSRGWPGQADALGAPAWAIRSTPFVEIVIGAALVAGVHDAAIAAIALLVAFTVLLVRALARGVKAPCACFGSLRTRPVTWWSVARNVALIALAIFSLT
jgi:uncharacterized membrane protein YphA (DoxX/SURF4 family)